MKLYIYKIIYIENYIYTYNLEITHFRFKNKNANGALSIFLFSHILVI